MPTTCCYVTKQYCCLHRRSAECRDDTGNPLSSRGTPGQGMSGNAHCRVFWIEPFFCRSFDILAAADRFLKIKFLSLLCILASLWLICTTKIVSLENYLEIDQHKKTWPISKHDFLSLIKSDWLFLTCQCKIMGLSLFLKVWIPQSSSFWSSSTLKKSLPGRARINCLKIWQISYNYWKHFRGLSLDLVTNEHIISIKVYSGQEDPECLGNFLCSSFRTLQWKAKFTNN